MSLTVAVCGLYQTGGYIKLVISMAIVRHPLLQFLFQKGRGDLEATCRERPWYYGSILLNPF